MGRLPIVGVMGSGEREHRALSAPLGRRLAQMDVHLLTGGGGGVMAAVSREFARVQPRPGRIIGVLPSLDGEEPRIRSGCYPNPWVEVPIRTHLGRDGSLPTSRNHINVLSSDVVVALPGGRGTASEVDLAIKYGRPLVLFGDPGRSELLGGRAHAARTLADVVAFIRRWAGPEEAR